MEFPSENEFYFHNPSPSHCEVNWEEGMKSESGGSVSLSFSQSKIKGNVGRDLCEGSVDIAGVETQCHICISSSKSQNLFPSGDDESCETHPRQSEPSNYLLQIDFNQAIRTNYRQSQSDENVCSSSSRSETTTTACTTTGNKYPQFHLLGNDGDVERENRHSRKKVSGSLSKSRHSSDSYCHSIKDNLYSNGEQRDGSSWLEEIQFTAQYQHFRSIDYASIVNSAVSLDRVQVEPEVIKQIRIERDDLTGAKDERGSLCWNFPRVKLRRLFNAKSLDDILGRSSRKGTISQQCSESTNSIHNQLHSSKNNAHSYSNLSKDSRSYSNSKVISIAPQVLATSSSENNCYTAAKGAGDGNGSGTAGRTTSKSSGGISLFLTADHDQDHTGRNLSVPGKQAKGKSGAYIKAKGRKSKAGAGSGSSQVKCAKSDNCLHRIVSSACTKLVTSSVDNLDARGSGPDTISQNPDTSAENNGERYGLNFTLPIPVSVQVKQLELKSSSALCDNLETQSSSVPIGKVCSTSTSATTSTSGRHSNSGEKLPVPHHHHRKRSQVSPEEELPSSQEVKEILLPKLLKTPERTRAFDETLISDCKDSNLDSSESRMPKEKAKLVVANVGYLQRPLSPTPATFPGTGPGISVFPSQPTNTNANSNVFRALNNGGGLSGTSAAAAATTMSRSNFFSPLSSSDSTSSRKNTTTSQNQWPLSNTNKCVNSSYSYNNYNNSSNPPGINWNNFGGGGGSGSGVGGRQRQQNSSQFPHHNANNENVSSFQFSKSKLEHRHGQDDVGNYSPSQSKGGMLGGRNVVGGRGPASILTLRTTSPTPTSHPEQFNNNQNVIRNSPGHLISHSPRLIGKGRQEYEDTICDSPLTGGRNYPKNRAALKSSESNNSSPQNLPSDAETEGMGDLQSPQYVKRTAHMFDSRYSTSQVNGTKALTRRNADGTDENLTGHHNEPSYLSVSRSVSGYSCLSYNNGTTPTSMTGTTNGISSSSYKSHRQSGVCGVRSDSSTAYRPVSLQTNNGHNIDVREHEVTITGSVSSQGVEIDNSQNSGMYTHSRKSNIMEKIERLYGSNAVSSTALWRRPVPLLQMPSSEPSRTTRSTGLKAANGNIIENSVVSSKNGGNIIPIFVEGSAKPMTRNGCSQGELDDSQSHCQPITPTATITVKNSSGSSADNGTDNKIRDDLYSKHDILNGNRRQNQHTNGHGHNLDISKRLFDANVPIVDQESTPPFPAHTDSNDERVVTSRSWNKSETLITESISPVELNQNQISELTPEDSTIPDILEENFKEPETSLNMGKDLVQLSDIDERVSLCETQDKTEDTTDGESRQIFKVVSNLSPENESTKKIQSVSPASETERTDFNSENIIDLTCDPEEKNGEYFLKVIQVEKTRIQGLIKTAEAQLEKLDVSEDSPDYELSGKILAAIGKARLLTNKKFKQFEGLCNDNNEQRKNGVGTDQPYTTKNEDLEGFWDMVLIQVDQIHSMFKNLDNNDAPAATVAKLTTGPGKKNGSSKKASTQRSPLSSTPKTSATSTSKSSGNAARDELRKRMLAEKRQAMKNQMGGQSPTSQESTNPDIQIFVPDNVS